MRCEECEYNLGTVCQASLPGSKLEGCDPFVDEVQCIECREIFYVDCDLPHGERSTRCDKCDFEMNYEDDELS